MTVAANGNLPVHELKSQIADLKTAISEAVKNKAEIATVTRMQTQLDALDVKLAQKFVGDVHQQKSLGDFLKENDDVQRLVKDRRGKASFELNGVMEAAVLGRKSSIITGITTGNLNGDPLAPVGAQTTGVLPIFRIPGIVPEARQTLKIRDVLSARPTTFDVVDYVKVNTPLSIASPVAEASLKPENQLTFTSYSERIKLLATFIIASRQVLSDFGELMGFLESSLGYYVDLSEELQLLAGDGVGEDWHGLIPQAGTFNTSLLPKPALGWTKIDVIATAVEQINVAKEIDPTFVVLHPSDWWSIRLTKDGFGRYILGDPQAFVRSNIFGLDVVVTTSMAQGTFLVGSGSPVAAEIRDRMGTVVEISLEDSDNFRRNLATVRCEKRGALIVKRNASFIFGSFTTSP
jgi:HK97 family phage major capsid protein